MNSGDKRELQQTQALVARARSGDRGALDELFHNYGESLRRSTRERLPASLNGRLDTSDVVQDALVDAVAHFDQFEYRGHGSFRRWLGQVLHHRVLMTIQHYLGRKKRDARRETRDGGVAKPENGGSSVEREFTSPRTSPSAAAIRNERRSILERALATLPADHAEVVRLVRLEEKSIAQAAAAMGRTENAVKKLLARALLSLSDTLENAKDSLRTTGA